MLDFHWSKAVHYYSIQPQVALSESVTFVSKIFYSGSVCLVYSNVFIIQNKYMSHFWVR